MNAVIKPHHSLSKDLEETPLRFFLFLSIFFFFFSIRRPGVPIIPKFVDSFAGSCPVHLTW